MTPEDKQRLLKDLSARLPYGANGLITVHITMSENSTFNRVIDGKLYDRFANLQDSWYDNIPSIKPYLRPLSSMTEEEKGDINNIIHEFGDKWFESGTPDNHWSATFWECSEITDYLVSHHFDFRGLIPMGLALEAPEGMYKF